MSLISTADLRIWMGIEEGDKSPNAKLSLISQSIEEFVDSFTNRKLEAQRYLTDPSFCYIDGKGKDYIYLPQYPVSYVSSVNMDADRVFGSGTLFSSSDYYWYPKEGKIRLSGTTWSFDGVGGGFFWGRRNILVDYVAGYAPIALNGTHNASVSTYPLPSDIKQVMIEMCVESFKEGMTAVHSVGGQGVTEPKFIQSLTRNSFWMNVLNKYKNIQAGLDGRDE